jgi:hypothetical protein
MTCEISHSQLRDIDLSTLVLKAVINPMKASSTFNPSLDEVS